MAPAPRSDLSRNGGAVLILGALGMVFSLLAGACTGGIHRGAAIGIFVSLLAVVAGVALLWVDKRRDRRLER